MVREEEIVVDKITDADRQAALSLRVILADTCGFWHPIGDDSPLCVALARHRIQAEQRLIEKIVPLPSPRVVKRRVSGPPPGEAPPSLEDLR